MKKKPAQQRHVSKKEAASIKKRLTAALSMLLIGTMMLGYSTYAWLTLSIAPEVSGIQTNVGANGSLEITLLNSETALDFSSIKSAAMGQSLQTGTTTANNTWGNLIDLSSKDYGLNNIVLLPSRLNLKKSADNTFRVDSSFLSVPSYGYDGRVIDVTDGAISAIYNKGNSTFATTPGQQDYGVRAIGTANSLSTQSSALAQAKAQIITSSNSAKTAAVGAIQNNASGIFGIITKYSSNSSFDNDDVLVLKNMISTLNSSAESIDTALRHGLVAYASSTVADESVFATIKATVLDKDNELASLIVQDGIDLPETFTTWVNELDGIKNDLNLAKNACDNLTEGTYTWAQIKGAMDFLMNIDKIYLSTDTDKGKLISELGKDGLSSLITKNGLTMTLVEGSGVFADISEFIGNYSALMTYVVEITVETLTNPQPMAHLSVLQSGVSELKSSSGNSADQKFNIDTTYGYAIDLAFRCNAPLSDLLLQTEAAQRIYADSEASATMGGGSYMEFVADNEKFTVDATVRLMDAIRVVFLDSEYNVLGLAKLNVANRRITNETTVTAPLYLYDYDISTDEATKGALVIGERRKINNVITSLDQNIAKAVTVVVYLDGDLVDNTMVPNNKAAFGGILNLQFASSADLIPAGNSQLFNATTSKTDLSATINEAKLDYDLGQGQYTTTSWNDFKAAYSNACAINESETASSIQIYRANTLLIETKTALENANPEVLKEKIDEIRQLMGQTEDVKHYLEKDEETGKYAIITDPRTQEQIDQTQKIYCVDFNKNLHDEGNDIKTQIYSDSSWANLAATLYEAEIIYFNKDKITEKEIDDTITALKKTVDALERQVFYIPYEYETHLYYFAIPREEYKNIHSIEDIKYSEETTNDIYGKWYDSNLHRIIDDLTILELNTYAERTNIATITYPDYISNERPDVISPVVELTDANYPLLNGESIKAIKWVSTDAFEQYMTSEQKEWLTDLFSSADNYNIDVATERHWLDMSCIFGKYVTASQKQLLINAVATAKSVENYETDEANSALRSATAVVEKLLNETNISQYTAYTKLYKLSTELNKVSDKTVEIFTLPTKQEAQDVINTLESKLEVASIREVITSKITTAKNTVNYDTNEMLKQAVTAAEEILAKTDASSDKLTNALNTLNSAIGSTEPMTADQRTLLTTAIEAAKTVENYSNKVEEGQTDPLMALKDAVSKAEEVLQAASTQSDATDALAALNVQLKANGKTEITEYNALPKDLAIGEDTFTLTYSAPYTYDTFTLTSPETGKVTLTAVVLTKNGIINTISKTITVYAPVDGTMISHSSEEIPEGGNDLDDSENVTVWDNKLYDEATTTLTAELIQATYTDSVGNSVMYPEGETISACTWSSDKIDIVKVSDTTLSTATITGVDAGTAKINVSIETVQGNTYTAEFEVTVILAPITEEQKTTISNTVNEAKAIDGYADRPEFENLRKAVTGAEELVSNNTATRRAAKETIETLTATITKAKDLPVSENTAAETTAPTTP